MCNWPQRNQAYTHRKGLREECSQANQASKIIDQFRKMIEMSD